MEDFLAVIVLTAAVCIGLAVCVSGLDTDPQNPTDSCQAQQQTQTQLNSVQSQLNAVQAQLAGIEHQLDAVKPMKISS